MANATVQQTEKIKMVPAVTIEKTVHLTLSEEEAKILSFILGMVGGSPTKSPRGKSEDIYTSLAMAGIVTNGSEFSLSEDNNRLYFKDYVN